MLTGISSFSNKIINNTLNKKPPCKIGNNSADTLTISFSGTKNPDIKMPIEYQDLYEEMEQAVDTYLNELEEHIKTGEKSPASEKLQKSGAKIFQFIFPPKNNGTQTTYTPRPHVDEDPQTPPDYLKTAAIWQKFDKLCNQKKYEEAKKLLVDTIQTITGLPINEEKESKIDIYINAVKTKKITQQEDLKLFTMLNDLIFSQNTGSANKQGDLFPIDMGREGEQDILRVQIKMNLLSGKRVQAGETLMKYVEGAIKQKMKDDFANKYGNKHKRLHQYKKEKAK